MPEASGTDPVTGSDGESSERAPSTPISVNWHVWPWCNFECTFCFTTFPGAKRVLPLKEALQIPRVLRTAGTEKLTFAGGEPTLCPYLPDLLRAAKSCGMITMVVTNATQITEAYLRRIAQWTDWIAISVDSVSNEVEAALGRGWGDHVDVSRKAARLIRASGIRLKVNTVVTARTCREDMHGLIRELQPERWKVFQALPIRGENDTFDGWVGDEEFRGFLERHSDLNPVGEDNDAMAESYVMLDPLGRFFQNSDNVYRYSTSILEAGVLAGLRHVGWDAERFERRGGRWEWMAPRGDSTLTRGPSAHRRD